MNKWRLNYSLKEMSFLVGVLMMALATVNYYLFDQDWLAVCMFGIGCIGFLLSILVKDN